ncbi:MAG: hypothetical protein GX444_15515 [Myxococcales bacterium]|nr:hypothetical protein [Myxococcales bacterium]
MVKRCFLIFLLLFPVFGVIALVNHETNSQSAENEKSSTVSLINHRDKVDVFEDEQLGDGAFAEWSAKGWCDWDAKEACDVSTLKITGSKIKDKSLRLTVRDRIGSLEKEIAATEIFLPKNQVLYVPLDALPALTLHDKQYEYTTTIKVDLFVPAIESGGNKYHQMLAPLFVAINEDEARVEIMDFSAREEIYPYGFTTDQGQAEVTRILAENHDGEWIEDIGPGI